MLEEGFQRVLRQRCYGAGLNVRRQARLNPDTLLRQEIHQGAVFYRLHAVTDTFGAQLADGLPDAFRASRFTRVHGNVPAGIARAVEVGEEQAAREAQLVTGEIDGGDGIAMGQQRFQLLQAGGFTERTAHDADQASLNVEGFTPFADAFNDGFHDACNGQVVGHRHVARREAQLDVVQAVAGGIFDVLKRHAAAGIQRRQHFHAPVEFAQEADQVRFIRGHLHVRDQGLKGLSRKR